MEVLSDQLQIKASHRTQTDFLTHCRAIPTLNNGEVLLRNSLAENLSQQCDSLINKKDLFDELISILELLLVLLINKAFPFILITANK